MKKMSQAAALIMTAAMAFSLSACGGAAKTGGSKSAEGTTKAGTETGTTSEKSSDDKYAYLLDSSGMEKPTINTDSATGELRKVIDSGVLVISTSPDYAPNEWVDETGKLYGSELMLAKYVADCLGVKLQIETMDFNGTLVAVDSGKVNASFSGFGWKKDREENYNLTIGYEGDEKAANHTLITTKANEGKFKSLQDFVGSRITAQATSLQEMYVQDEILSLDQDGSTSYEPVATLDQAILALASGKTDAVALSGTQAENYVKESDGQFVLTGVDFDLTPYGDYEGNVAAVKKGEQDLTDAINQCLQTVKDEGYYTKWYKEASAQAGVDTE